MKHILLTIGDISITGGAERVVVNLANELCKYYKVSICSIYRTNSVLPFNIDSRINLHFLYNDAESNIIDRTRFKRLYYKNIHKLLLNLTINKLYKDCDYVIVSDWTFTPFIKNLKTTYIKLIHLNFTRYNTRNKYFNTLIILSCRQLSIWQQYHKDVRVIPNFLSYIPHKSANISNKIVLSVGRLSEQKGFLRLIDIWEIIKQDSIYSDWKLCIVGSGKQQKEIESTIQSKHLQDSIIVKPFTNEIDKEYLNASIYVMTSYFEGFPMVLLESASYGLSAIAFDVNTGPSDIIEDSISGFLVEDNNINEFALKLKILMNDESKRKTFGENAKRIVLEKFSKQAIIQQWINIIEERNE